MVAIDAGERSEIGRVCVAIAAACPDPCVVAGVDREPGVLKHRPQPGDGGVAGAARCGKHGRGVIRIRGAGVIRLMTAVTVCGEAAAVVPLVTRVAGDVQMLPGQREPGFTVIEACRDPRRRGVANIAGVRESGLHMVRVRCAIEIVEMTRNTRCRHRLVLAVLVA